MPFGVVGRVGQETMGPDTRTCTRAHPYSAVYNMHCNCSHNLATRSKCHIIYALDIKQGASRMLLGKLRP